MSHLKEESVTTPTQNNEKEINTESQMKQYIGPMSKILTAIFIFWFIFQMYFSSIGILDAIKLRAWTLGFLLVLTFLLFPAKKVQRKIRRLPTKMDMLLIFLSIASVGYLILMFDTFAREWGGIHRSNWNYVFGGIGIIMLFEASRRVVGNILTIIAAVFLLYDIFGEVVPGVLGHRGFSLERIIDLMFWGPSGIFGIALGVFATYVFMFVLFGAFLKNSGFSDFINDLALTLAGRSAGGPAKVSVIGSATMGMISGSAVGNVVTTGAITIPLMKKTGYSSRFAGAVEAVASTGGLFAPPIMGAAGFIMAEFIGVPYSTIMLAAIIPALLYFITIFMAVHFEAKRIGLSGISKENIPNALQLLKDRGHLLLPLIVLVWLLVTGVTPIYAAVWALGATVVASWFRKSTRMGWKDIIRSIEEGCRGAIIVGIACSIVGIIVGTITLTSLGLVIGNNILHFAGENLFLAGFLTMIISIILGMGMPATAAYIIVATISAPVLVELGVPAIVAHMFAFVYASLSNITPPVALSSYAASGIAGVSPNRLSFTAIKLGITGFIIPFFFLYNPVLLFSGENIGGSIQALITASIGVVCLAGGLQGWLIGKASILQRISLFIIALLMITPSLVTDAAGIVVLALIVIWQRISTGKDRNMSASVNSAG
ncbi:TRAP transporter permease [Alteribacillus iranensis]|uniref:TRAP transporter, 4TM/12TM fusion protein n=1 Tax=Alteribacillus iranensis TaxID=930128 RepID=A0A1I2BHY7_9BACI|nr:TRAP transporter permease [Alteribacillus iranensis]SFE54800.1 TRAP transporter, 4TM/12TM fusion protein [Alteribacillus iranensis]